MVFSFFLGRLFDTVQILKMKTGDVEIAEAILLTADDFRSDFKDPKVL